MPIWNYKCDLCDFQDEYIVSPSIKDSTEEPSKCPKCENGKLERMFSMGKTLAIDFVGPGFYINDYGKHAWKKNLSPVDQAKVLSPDINGNYKNPY